MVRFFQLTVIVFAMAIALSSMASLCVAIVDDDPTAGLMPEALVSIGNKGSYALLVSKSDSRLDVYRQFDSDKVEKIATYQISTGRGLGDKQVEGDLKTPEGIYYFVRIREDKALPSKYGIRAFDLNYPNRFDLLENKTGYGIWLHGTDEPERLSIPRTSEGCVVVSNEDLKNISEYLTLYRTPVIIGEDIAYTDVSAVAADRNRIREFVAGWLKAWSEQDIESYENCYHEDFRGGKGRRNAWFSKKQRVFEATEWATISTSDVKILRHNNETVISFYQNYHSNLMDDTGVKWIYLKDVDQKLKIISEEWHPISHIRSGKHWHQNTVRLNQLLAELDGLELDKNGKIRIEQPDLSFSNKPELMADNNKNQIQKAQTETSGADSNATTDSSNGDVRVENARTINDTDRNITLEFDVRNKQQTGKRRRGWVYIVATWDDGNSHTSFPQGVTDAVPQQPKQGDYYGIRWFKTVVATIEKPTPDSTLDNVHAYVYDHEGKQIGGYIIIDQPSEVQ